jgi:hypothetical protein
LPSNRLAKRRCPSRFKTVFTSAAQRTWVSPSSESLYRPENHQTLLLDY